MPTDKGTIEEVETATAANGEEYRRYIIAGKTYTAFKECKGQPAKGERVSFRFLVKGDYRNITEFYDDAAFMDEDSYFRMVSNQVFAELKARNMRVTDEAYETEWVKVFSKLAMINETIRKRR